MLEMLAGTQFWVDVLKIIMIDVLLSGDNAVVIALACRNLPAQQRKKGVLFGMAGAVLLRIVLTFFAVSLLSLPYLKLVGALLLIWIGIKLILPEDEHNEDSIKADARLIGAIKTIIIAGFVDEPEQCAGCCGGSQGQRAVAGIRPPDQHSADRLEQPAGVETDRSFPLYHLCGWGAAGIGGG